MSAEDSSRNLRGPYKQYLKDLSLKIPSSTLSCRSKKRSAQQAELSDIDDEEYSGTQFSEKLYSDLPASRSSYYKNIEQIKEPITDSIQGMQSLDNVWDTNMPEQDINTIAETNEKSTETVDKRLKINDNELNANLILIEDSESANISEELSPDNEYATSTENKSSASENDSDNEFQSSNDRYDNVDSSDDSTDNDNVDDFYNDDPYANTDDESEVTFDTELKAQNVISSGKYDVVNLAWLERATRSENLSMIREFHPWELFSASPETRRLINDIYDEYWDSFVEDTQEETLRRAMEKAKQSFKTDSQLSTLEMKKLDDILFDNHISPFSVFRGKTGYFHDQDDLKKYSFAFMNGAIFEEFTKNVDYVFIGDDIPIEAVESYKNKEENDKDQKFTVLKNKWISDCFAKRRLLSTENYVI